MLQSRPELISNIVETFFYRDELDNRAAARMKRFLAHPSTSPDYATVCTQVRFTRCLYAQATQQKFFPPKIFKVPAEWRMTQHPRHEVSLKIARITL